MLQSAKTSPVQNVLWSTGTVGHSAPECHPALVRAAVDEDLGAVDAGNVCVM